MAKRRGSPVVKLPPLPRVLVPHPHVRCDSRLLGGSPHVDGTRVPVRRLWAWHRSGVSIDTLLRRYPKLGPAKVLDALAFAYDNRDVVEADLAREMAAFEAAGQKPLGIRPMAQQLLSFMDDSVEPSSEGPPTQRSPKKSPKKSATAKKRAKKPPKKKTGSKKEEKGS